LASFIDCQLAIKKPTDIVGFFSFTNIKRLTKLGCDIANEWSQSISTHLLTNGACMHQRFLAIGPYWWRQ
jgi:hypothetical protein